MRAYDSLHKSMGVVLSSSRSSNVLLSAKMEIVNLGFMLKQGKFNFLMGF